MKVVIKTMGVLKSLAPAGGHLDVAEGTSLAAVLERLEIPANRVQACMVNGKQQIDRAAVLSEGDEVLILPPVAGG